MRQIIPPHRNRMFAKAEVYRVLRLPRYDHRKALLPHMVYFMEYGLQSGQLRDSWPVEQAIEEALACGYVRDRPGNFYATEKARLHWSGQF